MSRPKLTPTEYRKMKYRKRRNSEHKYNKKLKSLSECPTKAPCNAISVENSVSGKTYYKRIYRDKYSYGYRANYKKIANRKVRRSSDDFSAGGGYRRIFDYWWTII